MCVLKSELDSNFLLDKDKESKLELWVEEIENLEAILVEGLESGNHLKLFVGVELRLVLVLDNMPEFSKVSINNWSIKL